MTSATLNPGTRLCFILLGAFIWFQIVLVGITAFLRMQNNLPLGFDFSAAMPVVNASTLSKTLTTLGIAAALASQFLRSRIIEEGAGVPFPKWIVGLVLAEFAGLCGFIVSFMSNNNFEIQVIFSAIAIVCLATFATLARSVVAPGSVRS